MWVWVTAGEVFPCIVAYIKRVTLCLYRHWWRKPHGCLPFGILTAGEVFPCIAAYIKRVTLCFVLPLIKTIAWLLKRLAIINQFWLVKSGIELTCLPLATKDSFHWSATALASCPLAFWAPLSTFSEDWMRDSCRARSCSLPYGWHPHLWPRPEGDWFLSPRIPTKDPGSWYYPEKCKFSKQWLTFLGYIINQYSISPHPSKTTAVLEMEMPKSLAQIEAIHGVAESVGRVHPQHSRFLTTLVWASQQQEEVMGLETCPRCQPQSDQSNACMRLHLF